MTTEKDVLDAYKKYIDVLNDYLISKDNEGVEIEDVLSEFYENIKAEDEVDELIIHMIGDDLSKFVATLRYISALLPKICTGGF